MFVLLRQIFFVHYFSVIVSLSSGQMVFTFLCHLYSQLCIAIVFLYLLCSDAALRFTKKLFTLRCTGSLLQMQHRVMSEHPSSVFTVKTGYQCECWFGLSALSSFFLLLFSHMVLCSFSLSLPLSCAVSFSLWITHKHACTHAHIHMHTLTVSLFLPASSAYSWPQGSTFHWSQWKEGPFCVN